MQSIKSNLTKLKTKRVFLKKGTCSRTFFYILDREFGYPLDDEEGAVDHLAGGILQQGFQCGMLWGASMALGAESFRRSDNHGQAISKAIRATQIIMDSFVKRTKSIECVDITNCDMTNNTGMAKFFLSGKIVGCLRLAGKWAPEAIEAAYEGLSAELMETGPETVSCATELVKRMGGSEEESMMVAGFAGGLGLSGNGCGALAAAIWMKSLIWNRKQKGKQANHDQLLETFYGATEYEMECSKICGQKFLTIDEHTEFIKNGGCEKLIDLLAKS
jgi:hypothetical protein